MINELTEQEAQRLKTIMNMISDYADDSFNSNKIRENIQHELVKLIIEAR